MPKVLSAEEKAARLAEQELKQQRRAARLAKKTINASTTPQSP
jgi:hypothetical protein